ncbi:hypothetical protein [Streptomyces sp. NRRL F-2580]|uniref:hypothetical protein n=1 Tax=Streptomyces sp. NRRL F-2580 TaxID=1463841 RepID=UPI000AFD140C|nr:hypothetical protein [Streptomyces sp. NRRL F-2580]
MSTSWQYDIRADLEWQPTEIRKVAETGKGLSIRAEGEWKYRKDLHAVDADGVQKGYEGATYDHLRTQGRAGYLHAAPDGYLGTLIGKWGPDGSVFKVGKHRIFTDGTASDISKTLYLAMNDESGAGFKDNEGVMHVRAYIFDNRDREQHWSYDRIAGTWSSSTS